MKDFIKDPDPETDINLGLVSKLTYGLRPISDWLAVSTNQKHFENL